MRVKRIVLLAFVLLIFLNISFVPPSLNIKPSVKAEPVGDGDWIIDGDTVYINDSNAYLSATPHTINGRGWVEFELENKVASIDIDCVFGINNTYFKVSNPQIWRNYTHDESGWTWVERHNNLTFYDVTDFTVLDIADYDLYPDVVGKKENNTQLFSFTSSEGEYYIACLDYSIDGNNYTFHYLYEDYSNYIYQADYFDWQPLNLVPQTINYEYGGMNKWFLFKNIPTVKDVRYKFRAYLEPPFGGFNGTSGKYWWAIKPSSETISEAISNGHFYVLDPWWDYDWGYRKEITIESDFIDSTLTNFPVLVSTTLTTSKVQSDGGDIVFIASDDTTQYNHEIESYDDGTGELVAWVNITSLSNTEDTVLWIYYDNPGVANQWSIVDTWDSDYIMVQHLNETSGDHEDSTVYNNDLVLDDSMTGQGTATGIAGKCDDFERTNTDRITSPDVEGPYTYWTFEAWVKFETLVDFEQLWVSLTSVPHVVAYADGHLHGGNAGATATGVVDTVNWFYIVNSRVDATYTKVYVDTVEEASRDIANPMDDVFEFGGYTGFGYWYDGLMDEIRISKITRTTDWMDVSFHSQNQSTGFMTLGIEEEPPAAETSVDDIDPYWQDDVATVAITATTDGGSPDNVTLYYRWSDDNSTWDSGGPSGFPELHNWEYATGTTSTTVVVNKPADTVENDLLVAFVATDGVEDIYSPGDWTGIAHVESDACSLASYYKVATDSEPSDYTFGWGTSEDCVGSIVRITGANITSPINANTTDFESATGQPVIAPDITPTINNCTIFRVCVIDDNDEGDDFDGWPDGHIGVLSKTDVTCSHSVAYENLSSGSAGTAQWTFENNEEFVTFSIAIEPSQNSWNFWKGGTNPDLGSPWEWTFDCPNETGYYEFYSIADLNGTGEESAPSENDTQCHVNYSVANNPPTFANEAPTNQSIGVSLQKQCYVVCNDADGGDTLTVDWYDNTTGDDTWIWQSGNTSVSPGENHSFTFTNADTLSTKYWWRVYSNDATDNSSDTYEFTTTPPEQFINNASNASFPVPNNHSVDISPQPICNLTVIDQDGNSSLCNFYTSPDGVAWTWVQTNSSVLNESISFNYTSATGFNTKYYWNVTCEDELDNVSFYFDFTTHTSGLWWDSDWNYYKTINIVDKIAGYQMELTVDNSTGDGNISCDSYAQDDFDDIRFLRTDNITELPYWIETVAVNNQATFWVNNTYNESTILMYYGNDAVGNTSNGNATFDFFDNFSYAEVNWGDKWESTDHTNYAISDGTLQCIGKPSANTEFICTQDSFSEQSRYRFKFKTESATDYTFYITIHDDNTAFEGYTDGLTEIFPTDSSDRYIRLAYIDNGDYKMVSLYNAWTATEWHLSDTKLYNENTDTKVYQYSDLVQKASLVGDNATFGSDRYFTILPWEPGLDDYYDWVTIGKYNITEPSWSIFGWRNSNPVASSPNPPDAQTDVELSLANYYNHFNISVTDADNSNQSVNVTWRTNESGIWLDMGYNESSEMDDTFYCMNVSWIDTSDTEHWWSVNVSDNHSTKGWDNKTYSFTTSMPPTSPTNLNASNETINSINLSWTRGKYTNDSLRPFTDSGSYRMLFLSGVTNPANIQYDNITYILHTDSNGDIDASYYNSSNQTWTTDIDVGVNPDTDEHGCPAFQYNATGIFHAFWGAHHDPFEYAISDSPYDVTSWTQQSDIGADGNTYPILIRLDNGSLLLFYRHQVVAGADNPINYRTEWGSFGDATEKTLVDWDSINSLYPKSFVLSDDGTKIYFSFNWYSYEAVKRMNIYCAYLLLSNFTCYSMSGQFLGNTVSETESRAYCEVHNSTGSEINIVRMDLDSNDNPYFVYTNADESYNFTYWTGSAWTTPTVITYCDDLFDTIEILVHSSTDIETYLTTNGTVEFPTRGGDLERWDWNGSEWSRERWILNASVSGRPLYVPQIVYNYTDDVKFVFSEWNDTIATDDLKGYLSGDSGILGLSPIYTHIRYSKSDNLTIRTDGSQAYNGTSTTYNLTGLDSETQYWFRAWSYSPNGGWNSTGSNVVNLTTEIANNPPTFADEAPTNQSIDVSLQKQCYVVCNDADGGDTLTIDFFSNESDGSTWVWQSGNTSVSPGENHSFTFTNADTLSTKYWWRVFSNDATVNVSDTYHFTTPAEVWLDIDSTHYDDHCEDDDGHTIEEALDGTDYWSHDAVETHYFELDLGRSYTISKIRGRSITSNDPDLVYVYISDDNSSWGTAVAGSITTWVNTQNWVEIDSTDKTGRYIWVYVMSTEDPAWDLDWGKTSSPYMKIFDVYGFPTANRPPSSSNEAPTNNSYNVTWDVNGITTYAVITDNDGDDTNITWWSNSSGFWKQYGVANTSVESETNISQLNANFTVNDTWYHWWILMDDGMGHSANDTYRFRMENLTDEPPDIIINFAGNLSDSGGPYWRPPGETTQLTGVWSDGYCADDSRQEEEELYINLTVTDSLPSVSNVWLNWYNSSSGWTNWTYAFNDMTGDFWEYNTSGNIDVESGHGYSFDIVANDTDGNSNWVGWNKTGMYGEVGDTPVRRTVQLSCTPVNISYTPYYFIKINETHQDPDDDDVYDRLHHDQGTNGTATDTGYLRNYIPNDNVEFVYCGSWVGFWFDESQCVLPFTLTNIHFHLWWAADADLTGSDDGIGWMKTREDMFTGGSFDTDMIDYYETTANDAVTNLTYDNGEGSHSNDYHLDTHLLDVTNTDFGDNDIYEFLVGVSAYMLEKPSIINNRSIMSYVIFNVPENILDGTDNSTDTDNDGLSDHMELNTTYGWHTNPFISDTDNDGVNDYHESLSGSDPNNFTDTVAVSLVFDINRTSFSFGTVQNDTMVYSNATQPDTFRIYNNGTCSIDIDINGTNATASGVTDWNLSSSNGDNQYKMEVYNSSTNWIQVNKTASTWYSNMAQSTNITANIRITTPTKFYSGKQMTCTIYMTASIH